MSTQASLLNYREHKSMLNLYDQSVGSKVRTSMHRNSRRKMKNLLREAIYDPFGKTQTEFIEQ